MADDSDKAAGAAAKPVIFISYSHKDKKWLDYVRDHFTPALNFGMFTLWADNELVGGDNIQEEITLRLDSCDIFIPLISENYLASSRLNEFELKKILWRRSIDSVLIYPIVITPIGATSAKWLSEINLRPIDSKALSDFAKSRRDFEMARIAEEIEQIAKQMAKGKGEPRLSPSRNKPSIIDLDLELSTADKHFVGRENELERLDAAWDDRITNIVLVIGKRGTGKTTLISQWLNRMRADNYRGADAVLGWSFLATKENHGTATDAFYDWAIRRLARSPRGRKISDLRNLKGSLKSDFIVRAMSNDRMLLVLDNVDMQSNRTGGSQQIQALLHRFAAVPVSGNSGLIVVTSESPFDDIGMLRQSVAVVDLGASIAGSHGATDGNNFSPPSEPLPSPGPATHFAYVDGQFDVVPSTAWGNRGAQAAAYHARARALASALADRLSRTDAVPDVAGSVGALVGVLGDDITQVQPDQLRLASRSIAARARVYGHPAAEWEISAESVSNFFELADVLVDLQTFARTDLEAHENAIRQLDLTRESAAEAKISLDLLTDVVLSTPELISERVEVAFDSAATVSATAIDENVKVAIEGDRTLISTNLALAVARELGGNKANKAVGEGGGKPPGKRPPDEPLGREPREPEKRKRLPRRKQENHEHAWADFLDRVMSRIHKKGPDAIGDATVQAAASIIKHSPKTVSGLAAALLLLATNGPILAGGAVAATMAWIAYEIRRKK